MDTKTPREKLHETLDASRREMEQWPQWMKDGPPVFDSRPDVVESKPSSDEPKR